MFCGLLEVRRERGGRARPRIKEVWRREFDAGRGGGWLFLPKRFGRKSEERGFGERVRNGAWEKE